MKREKIVIVLFVLLVLAALSWKCTTERAGYGTPGVSKMTGYVPYSPTFSIKHNACKKGKY